MTCKAHFLSVVSLLIAILTILIVLATPAQLTGEDQSPVKSTFASTPRYASPPLFRPTVTYDSGGQGATSVAVADVNRDGKPDLLVTNYCGDDCTQGRVDVLLGNGDGTFQPAVSYASGGSIATSVVVADVNGDGTADLVVTNFCTSSINCPALDGVFGSLGAVTVLIGNADGTFQSPVTYGSGGYGALSVAVEDVNGDGKPDLLVANHSPITNGSVGVLIGNGDGTFQTAVTYGSGGIDASWITVADVNGDGKPDVLVANQCIASKCPEGAVGVLLGNGDGSFKTAVPYGSGGFDSMSVAVADLNGDGKLDVLVTNLCPVSNSDCGNYRVSGTVGVLLGNGDGSFQPVVTYRSGGIDAWSVAVADVNGDGKPDVLVTNYISSTVGVLLGNGNGTFQPAMTYASGGNPTNFAAADVNGDGSPDVLVANYCKGNCTGEGVVGVLLNKPTTSTAITATLDPSTYGQKITWTAKVTSSGGVTPTGKVEFTWSIYTIGSATLNSNGVATFSRSNLNADTYPLTAVYVGEAANLGSTSPVLNQVVLETTSAAALTSSPNPSTQGQAVSFTAKISSPTVIPTGPVTFTAGKTVLGTAQLSGGKATLTISSLAVGSTKVTATYYGDSNIAKSSASVIQIVQ
jgi:hypothetical protein